MENWCNLLYFTIASYFPLKHVANQVNFRIMRLQYALITKQYIFSHLDLWNDLASFTWL